LGVLTKRANQNGTILGMAIGLISMLLIWHYKVVAFTWWVLIGAVITFSTGYIASLFFTGGRKELSSAGAGLPQ
jgi:Na+/proline symporter